MTRYLIRECYYCGGVMKLQVVNNELVNLEGCKRYKLWKPYRRGHRNWLLGEVNTTQMSKKSVVCINYNKDKRQCGRMALISKFKEIIL